MARMQRTNHWTGADRSGLTAADRDRLIAAFPSDTFCWVQRTIRSLSPGDPVTGSGPTSFHRTFRSRPGHC